MMRAVVAVLCLLSGALGAGCCAGPPRPRLVQLPTFDAGVDAPFVFPFDVPPDARRDVAMDARPDTLDAEATDGDAEAADSAATDGAAADSPEDTAAND